MVAVVLLFGFVAIVRSGAPAEAGRVPLPADARPHEAWFPGFAIQLAGGTVAYPPQIGSARDAFHVSTRDVDLELRRIDDEEWQLLVHAKQRVLDVRFPWRTRTSNLDLESPRTTVLYPTMLGVAARASSTRTLGFDKRMYPGDSFAPLVVLSDARTAEVVAAANWPPRSVVPVYDGVGLGLHYVSGVAPGATQTFRALIARRDGDETNGRAPWLLAALFYRDWLVPRRDAANLDPGKVPAWLQESEGWQNIQLQNLATFDASALEARWARWKGLLPWAQLWGQMSDYAGRADPLVRAHHEEVGCCLDRPSLHTRYRSGLTEVLARIATEGHVGLYVRPRTPYARLDGPAPADAERGFLLGWLGRNRDQYGTNAFYVDVLGHHYFGEPFEIARFVRDALPAATVVEYAVDVYPRPALVSGSLGGGSIGGGPGLEPREIGRLSVPRTTFPRFGRAILADAILFLGESNGDHGLWGESSEHWAERQAFLLGAKLDAMHVSAALDRPEELNEAVGRIIALRRQAAWWRRRPVYLDRWGISGTPDDVDVRRFRGSGGEDIVVADNWRRRSPVTIQLDGRDVALSNERLSIQVIERRDGV